MQYRQFIWRCRPSIDVFTETHGAYPFNETELNNFYLHENFEQTKTSSVYNNKQNDMTQRTCVFTHGEMDETETSSYYPDEEKVGTDTNSIDSYIAMNRFEMNSVYPFEKHVETRAKSIYYPYEENGETVTSRVNPKNEIVDTETNSAYSNEEIDESDLNIVNSHRRNNEFSTEAESFYPYGENGVTERDNVYPYYTTTYKIPPKHKRIGDIDVVYPYYGNSLDCIQEFSCNNDDVYPYYPITATAAGGDKPDLHTNNDSNLATGQDQSDSQGVLNKEENSDKDNLRQQTMNKTLGLDPSYDTVYPYYSNVDFNINADQFDGVYPYYPISRKPSEAASHHINNNSNLESKEKSETEGSIVPKQKMNTMKKGSNIKGTKLESSKSTVVKRKGSLTNKDPDYVYPYYDLKYTIPHQYTDGHGSQQEGKSSMTMSSKMKSNTFSKKSFKDFSVPSTVSDVFQRSVFSSFTKCSDTTSASGLHPLADLDLVLIQEWTNPPAWLGAAPRHWVYNQACDHMYTVTLTVPPARTKMHKLLCGCSPSPGLQLSFVDPSTSLTVIDVTYYRRGQDCAIVHGHYQLVIGYIKVKFTPKTIELAVQNHHGADQIHVVGSRKGWQYSALLYRARGILKTREKKASEAERKTELPGSSALDIDQIGSIVKVQGGSKVAQTSKLEGWQDLVIDTETLIVDFPRQLYTTEVKACLVAAACLLDQLKRRRHRTLQIVEEDPLEKGKRTCGWKKNWRGRHA